MKYTKLLMQSYPSPTCRRVGRPARYERLFRSAPKSTQPSNATCYYRERTPLSAPAPSLSLPRGSRKIDHTFCPLSLSHAGNPRSMGGGQRGRLLFPQVMHGWSKVSMIPLPDSRNLPVMIWISPGHSPPSTALFTEQSTNSAVVNALYRGGVASGP